MRGRIFVVAVLPGCGRSGEEDSARAGDRLRRGVYAALASDRTRTRDLGGQADTRGFTDGVIAAMGS